MVQTALEQSETPEEKIARLEASGFLVPDCKQCEEAYESIRAGKGVPMMPNHKAKGSCLSGGKPHCTCDRCF